MEDPEVLSSASGRGKCKHENRNAVSGEKCSRVEEMGRG
jgi:hypothetical protein